MAQRDLLCCNFSDGIVAVPLEQVVGVVEGGPVTPLPYTASSFEGLVEALGQVMPQVDLGALLGLDSTASGILVVVSHLGGSLALRVPKVSAMISVDGDKFAAAARDRNALYLAEFEQGGQLVSVLDLDMVAKAEELGGAVPEGAVMLAEASHRAPPAAPVDDIQLVFLMLEVDGEPYAIRNSDIAEINLPHHVRPMPKSPDWIGGLIDLRGRPVVVLSTAALLGRDAASATAGDTPQVCLIAEIEPGLEVALAVDRAVGLERLSPDDVHTMPQAMAGVESYFVRGADEIVGIIDPVALVTQILFTLRQWLPQNVAAPVTTGEIGGNYRRFLTLRVRDELFGMALDRIERIQAAVDLTPLPDTIAFFDGMADVGDTVVPVIDLNRQLDRSLSSLDGDRHPPCILTMLEGSLTGILVDQVLSILDVPSDSIEPVVNAPKLPISHIVPHGGRMISILSIDRLLPAQS